MKVQTQQIAEEEPVAQQAVDAEPPASSLLGLQIKRRRPVNAGWSVGRPDGKSGTSQPPAEGARPTATVQAMTADRQAVAADRIEPAASVAATVRDAAEGPTAPEMGDIFAYWRDRRDGRQFPAWSDFDPDEILVQWPNSVLLACGEDLNQPRLAASFTEALRSAKRKQAEALTPGVEYTPLLTDWLLALGREVARLGKPLNDTESLPALKGRARYRVVGLPLGESPLEVDHVLCHVTRV